MGAKGYLGDDPKVLSMDMTTALKGHGDLFNDEVLNKVGYMPIRELYL